MFNMLGKIGNVGKELKELKTELRQMKVTESDANNLVTVTVNSNKEFESITLGNDFINQSAEDAQRILQETIGNAFSKAAIKGRQEFNERIEGKIPNIPGFDFKDFPFY